MLKLNTIMLGTPQSKVLADFYAKVFDREADWNDGGWYGWQFGSLSFTIGEHSEVNGKAKEPQRLILNLESDDVEREFERIKAIEGISVVKEPYSMEGWDDAKIATLADPDGNYFQLVSPWEDNPEKK